MNGYCTDEACPYWSWPQKVELDDLYDMTGHGIETKYRVYRRGRGLPEAEDPKEFFKRHGLPRISAIPATAQSDDGRKIVKFNAAPWFDQAEFSRITKLAEAGYSHAYVADDVAAWFEDVLPEMKEFYDYIGMSECGYEVYVDQEAVEGYLRWRRPDAYEGLRNKGLLLHEAHGNELVEMLLWESPRMDTLKAGKKPLDPEERDLVMKRKAVWHHGPKGQESAAVWKSVVRGKTWYVTNTHRCYQARPTLKGAIEAYHTVVKETS